VLTGRGTKQENGQNGPAEAGPHGDWRQKLIQIDWMRPQSGETFVSPVQVIGKRLGKGQPENNQPGKEGTSHRVPIRKALTGSNPCMLFPLDELEVD